ncbi:class I SAM-dependent methyltransferase [Methylophaga sp.]|uniref:class I SAM-dependent methyltransferase n=1 Tax=Methylophaga sp. TaxID=2024840 RepID=UPI003A93C709
MSKPKACRICGSTESEIAYYGPIRDGVFGLLKEGATIHHCVECGVEELDERLCPSSSFYETKEYREKLAKGLNSSAYFIEHDVLQIHTLKAIWPRFLRDAVIADIGCGGGALLDHLKGWTKQQIGIEPYELYRSELSRGGYEVYPYAVDAIDKWSNKVDLALSIQVIEHTEDPRQFLADIKPLLSRNGRLIISTPNREDILFDLLPDDFPEFFYRVVHRWYFDAASLTQCAQRAGYEVEEIKYSHRYSMSNALRWLRDRKPTGNMPLTGIDRLADSFWAGYLEKIGKSDCIYAVLKAK